MELQLVSKDVAMLAKELGFRGNNRSCFWKLGKHEGEVTEWDFSKVLGNAELVSRPEQELLAKWLRDTYAIDVHPICTYKTKLGRFYHLGIVFLNGLIDIIVLKEGDFNKVFDTYELAMEEGLLKALNLIKDLKLHVI